LPKYIVDPSVYEAGTKEAEEAVLSLCRRVAERVNANTKLVKSPEQHVEVWGVDAPPSTPIVIRKHDIVWTVSILPEDASAYHVPQSVDAKKRLFEELSGLTPDLILWADEKRVKPTYTVVPDEPIMSSRTSSTALPVTRSLVPARQLNTTQQHRKLDPMLILYIRVGRDRGVFVKVGEWYH